MKMPRPYRTALTALLMFSVMPTAQALTSEQAARRAANELVDCAAFYLSGSITLDKQGNAKQANQFEGFSRYALELARTNLPVSSIQRRMATAQAGNAELMKDGSITPLVDKYASTCKSALENPGARMNYWSDQDE